MTFRLRDAIASQLIAGPRILAAGSPITITGGHCHFLGLEADGEAEVRAAARRELKSGANCLKIMSTGGRMTPGTNIGVAQYSVAEIRAAVEEAQRAHVTIAAHALGTAGIRNATEAGVNTIEHYNWVGPDGTIEFDESVAVQMAAQATAMVPTLTPLQRSAVRDEVLECMRRSVALGAPIAAGTDAGVSLTPFDSLPGELELYVTPARTDADAGDSGGDRQRGQGARPRRHPGHAGDRPSGGPDRGRRRSVGTESKDLRQVRVVVQGGEDRRQRFRGGERCSKVGPD